MPPLFRERRLHRLARLDRVVAGIELDVDEFGPHFGAELRGIDVANASDDEVRAISFIEVQGFTTDQVISSLRGLPEIMGLHTTNGHWDLVAEISCRNLRAFDDLLRRMRSIKGVVNSETSLLLSSVVR